MLRVLFTLLMLVITNLTFAQSSSVSSRLVIVSPPVTTSSKAAVSSVSKSSVASSKLSSSAVAISSAASSVTVFPPGTKAVNFQLKWNIPVERNDANALTGKLATKMTPEETAGYLLEWKLPTEKEWYEKRFEHYSVTSYTLTDMPDVIWDVRIRSFDIYGLYSEAIVLPYKKLSVTNKSRPILSEFKACIPGDN